MRITREEARTKVQEFLLQNVVLISHMDLDKRIFSYHFRAPFKESLQLPGSPFAEEILEKVSDDNPVCVEVSITFFENFAQVQVFFQPEIQMLLQKISKNIRIEVLELVNYINTLDGILMPVIDEEDDDDVYIPYFVSTYLNDDSDIATTINLTYSELTSPAYLGLISKALPIRYNLYAYSTLCLIEGLEDLETIKNFLKKATSEII